MENNMHTVMLEADKCKGCVSCMKRCPTEAIRVREGKARVIYDRCIGCAECIRRCPHHAKLAIYDSFDEIFKFKYKIAIPAPSLYGQFDNLDSIDRVLNGLLAIGFDDVMEVSVGAELVTSATNSLIKEGKVKFPIINSACPAVVELINMCYHSLNDHILQVLSPAVVTAMLARERAINNGVKAEDIGVFFISPCPAKVSALKTGLTLNAPEVDGVLSISEVYFKLSAVMNDLTEIKPLARASSLGVGWAITGGEAENTSLGRYLAADGIENVHTVLKAMENGKLHNIDFVELNACPGGCVGGVLTIENPFVARARIKNLTKQITNKPISLENEKKPLSHYTWQQPLQIKDVFVLDENRLVAMLKLKQIDEIVAKLPQLDCGSCGAPSCRAFAEDIMNGVTSIDLCVRKQNDD